MVIHHEIEIAEWRVIGGVLQAGVRAQTLVDRAHFCQKGQQVPIGIAAATGAAVRLDAGRDRRELNMHAVPAHGDHFCRLDHQDRAGPRRLGQ